MKIKLVSFVVAIAFFVNFGCNVANQEEAKETKSRVVYDSVYIWENREWSPLQLMTTTYNADNKIENITEQVYLKEDRRLYKRIQELRASYYHRHMILTQKPIPAEGCWANGQYTDYYYDDNGQLVEIREGFYEGDTVTGFHLSTLYEYQTADNPTLIISRNNSTEDSSWKITSKDSVIYNDDGLKAEKYTFRNSPTPSYWYSYSYDSTTVNEIVKRRFNFRSNEWNIFEVVKESFSAQGYIFQIMKERFPANSYTTNQIIEKQYTFDGLLANEITKRVFTDSSTTAESQNLIDYDYDDKGNLITTTHKIWVNGLWVKQLQERFSYEEYAP